MASPAEAINNAKIGWQKLDVNQKMIIFTTVIMFLVALGSLAYWISRPSYTVLFSNLSPGDASSIVAKLQERKIPYKLVGTQVIEVPSDKVYETRIQLAGEGLPEGGTVGFEIFDQSSFGLSEFAQKLNYRRALEGELARTIREINEIDGARVHIVLPEPSLYKDKENPATASVVIKARPGARMAEGRVQGIVNLVARSVEGLRPENITVIDTNGNILNEATGDSAMATTGNYTKTQLGAKEEYESTLEKSIESMLAKMLGGESNAVVRVSAELDFTETKKQTNRVEQDENPVVISETVKNEKYEGQGAPQGGVPGVPAQVPGPDTSGESEGSTTYPQINPETGSSKYSLKETTRNFEWTKVDEIEVKPPGALKKLSVAVVVNNDGSKPVLNETIEKLVSAAAGIDESRGDVLTVSSVPFNTEWMKKEEEAIAQAQKREMYVNYGKYAMIAILLMVGLFILLKMASSLRPAKRPEEFIPKPISGLKLEEDEDLEDVDINDLTPERRKELRVAHRKRQLTREEVQTLAKERPGDVAQLLRIWLNT